MWKSPKGNTTVAKMWLGFLKYYLFEFDREAYSIRIDTKFLKSQVPPSKLLSIMGMLSLHSFQIKIYMQML